MGQGKGKVTKRIRMSSADGEKRKWEGEGIGGMMMGIKRETMEKETRMETEKEELMMGRIKRGKERWRIVRVSICKRDMERVLQDLEEWIGNREKGIKDSEQGNGPKNRYF